MANKKPENFNEISSDSIKARRLEEELRKTKREKEKIYNEFMEYKYDHIPSDLRRWLEKSYKFLTGQMPYWPSWTKFKIEFMEFCEWWCINLSDYKKKKSEWYPDKDEIDKLISEDIELPFDD